MRYAKLIRSDGKRDEIPCFDPSEFPFEKLNITTIKSKHKQNKNKPAEYINIICTFDIETTTIEGKRLYNEKGKFTGYDVNPYGFMYHWQMVVDGIAVYGRRWESWVDFMLKLVEVTDANINRRLICYIHNAGYEFQFMQSFLRNYFGGFKVFASMKRKPIYITCTNGIEFRCSYKLTNMSLAKATENELGVVHVKAVNDLDYKVRRTADTELDDTEFGYCISDVVSLYELIERKLINENDDLESIPLTSTGYVRRDCRNVCRKDPRYFEKFQKQTITPNVYTLLLEASRGGNTHANRDLAGLLCPNVDSFDVVSSYPSQILLHDDFPNSPFVYYGVVDTLGELNDLLDTKCCLFRAVFSNIRVKPNVPVPYIPVSKCLGKSKKIYLDNGRVLSAECLAITLTDVDFKLVRDMYYWDELSIAQFHTARRGQLPQAFRDAVMMFFKDKCELKHKIKTETDDAKRENYEYLYAKSKNRLNGIFGMAFTKPCHETVTIDDTGAWGIDEPNTADALAKYFRSRNNFVVYSWGVYITAFARQWLQTLIDVTNENGGMIYCDTDSSKCYNADKEKVTALNEEIKKLCETRGAYCDVAGERFYLGLYECETEKSKYKLFKTLGAKKYAYVDDMDALHITISGVQKKQGAKELETIDNFKPAFVFHTAGGSALYYNDTTSIYEITIDGCTMTTSSNIGMVDSTYEIGLTDEYAELIGYNHLDDGDI